MVKIKLLRNTQIDNVFHKEGDVVDVESKRADVLCNVGVCKKVKEAKPKKDGKK